MIDPQSLDITSLPWLPLEAKAAFPRQPAIYFAIDSLGNVQYVGRSVDPKSRWSKHHRYNELKAIGGIRIAYLFVDSVDLLPEIESALIAWFNPPLNGAEMEARGGEYSKFGQYAEAFKLLEAAKAANVDPLLLLEIQKVQASNRANTQVIRVSPRCGKQKKTRIEELQNRQDVQQWFEECITFDKNSRVQLGRYPDRSEQLYGNYCQWCNKAEINPLNSHLFSMQIKEIAARLGIRPITPKNKVTFRGFKLRQ